MAFTAQMRLVPLNERADRLHGLFTTAAARAMGASDTHLHRAVRAGRWKRVLPGVYAIASEPDTWELRARAAVLWAGENAVVSHRSAAKLHRFEGLPRKEWPVDVSLPRASGKRYRAISIHRLRDLQPGDRTEKLGIPCTGVVRTLLDLAACLDELDLAIAVESAWRADANLLETLTSRLDGVDRRGSRGTEALRRVLADCCARPHKPLDSPLEVRFWKWVLRTELPPPIPQCPYTGHGHYARFVDFAYPDVKLAIETDGFEFHREREDFERDAAKLSYLAARGWRVIHVTSRLLEDDADTIEKRIGQALELAAPPRRNTPPSTR